MLLLIRIPLICSAKMDASSAVKYLSKKKKKRKKEAILTGNAW